MKIASSREVYNCGLFRVTEDRAVDPKRGFRIKRSVVRHAGSAVMMAVDRRGRGLEDGRHQGRTDRKSVV